MTHAGTALIDPQKVYEKISLNKGMRIADLGCGRTGHFVFSAARIVGDTGIVYAIDIMRDILESLNHRIRSEGFDNVQTIWSDVEVIDKTPIPAGSLDVCFFINVMFMLTDRQSALKEAARLLKFGGTVVIIDWTKNLGPLGPMPNMITNPNSLVDLGAAVGFTMLENFSMGDYHYCLILKKAE